MCFLLYVGTTKALPRREFDPEGVNLPIESLTGRDAGIRRHFVSAEVQCVGSTSGCGCDFPHAMFQNGGWPELESQNTDDDKKDDLDAARGRVNRQNCEALVSLLRATGEELVELYGVWDGEFDAEPKAHEDVAIESLRASHFCFKEKGFYRVNLKP